MCEEERGEGEREGGCDFTEKKKNGGKKRSKKKEEQERNVRDPKQGVRKKKFQRRFRESLVVEKDEQNNVVFTLYGYFGSINR